ncbi:prepilin peptidase CpaA [Cricetibacter osteomyelitidis]|uniref:Prepilin peptidase CpaA n=1 Tax=Cricetibacter osteomyelitidis TaxID=1521931 RepID=A0A4R2TIM5_9PAST|nr:prepilin peptidase [Cricetibacter osteomyelitidis]TCP94652.1 prepilin peptidase CpaA [Cricetibacter osteomyelitidis]
MNEFIVVLKLLVIILLIILSYTDIRKRIISNNIVFLLFLIIMPLSWYKYNQIFIFSSLIFLAIGFLIFTAGVMGAGDIKLISVLMLSLPSEQLMPFFFFTTFSGLLLIIVGWFFFKESIKTNGLPYGVAISCGFLTNWFLFG